MAGLSGGKDGSEGLQGGILDISEQKELIKEISEQGFVAVDTEKGFHIVNICSGKKYTPLKIIQIIKTLF